MARQTPRPLTRNWLVLCILINQLATPGLGSLMARRFVSGACQLLASLAGFGMIMVWMGQFFYGLMLGQWGEPIAVQPDERLRKWGTLVFGASWLWALVTSLSLWMNRSKEEPGAGSVPPLLPK